MDIRSPFPGMDPWLEAHWGDVHASLITYARDALNPILPDKLRARADERVSPDGSAERFLNVINFEGQPRVLTTIEFLTPTIKQQGSSQCIAHLTHRQKMQEQAVNIVEIDLFRAGDRDFLIEPMKIQPEHSATYQVGIWRVETAQRIALWPIRLTDRLPTIPIPLSTGRLDVPLDLQRLIEQAYQNGGYDSIDYQEAPIPPLSSDDAAWADALLKSAGKR